MNDHLPARKKQFCVPFSPPIETSKKHLGLLFSAIIRANCPRKYSESFDFARGTHKAGVFPSLVNFLNSLTELSDWTMTRHVT